MKSNETEAADRQAQVDRLLVLTEEVLARSRGLRARSDERAVNSVLIESHYLLESKRSVLKEGNYDVLSRSLGQLRRAIDRGTLPDIDLIKQIHDGIESLP